MDRQPETPRQVLMAVAREMNRASRNTKALDLPFLLRGWAGHINDVALGMAEAKGEEGKGEPLPKTVGGPKTGQAEPVDAFERLKRRVAFEVEAIAAQREQIIRAFIAEHGFNPAEAEQVIQHTEEGTVFFVRRRNPAQSGPEAAQGSEARSARESSSGPSPESSPAAAPQGVEARPMRLRAEVYPRHHGRSDLCVYEVQKGSETLRVNDECVSHIAEEAAYRINHFEASGEGDKP